MTDFFSQAYLFSFSTQQWILVLLIFIWSGFVRSGLGFGGAALGLPLMLFVDDNPLFWLPVIGTHLLIFTAWTLMSRLKNVDWSFLKKSLYFILPAKLVGVFGLLNLPNQLLVTLIYCITLFYALLWLMDWKIKSGRGWSDRLLLLLGGYVSGTSLTGAPIIVAVYAKEVARERLRDTLFVLWFVLVTIKMSTFVAFEVSLHTASALMLIPAALIGHVIGMKAHDYMLKHDSVFKRVIGGVLIIICSLGFWRLFA